MDDVDGGREQKLLAEALSAFLRRCTHDHDVLERVARRFAVDPYLVGLLNTAFMSVGDGPFTEAMLRAANRRSVGSRFGPEHWSTLVARGYAMDVGEGWRLTPAGVAVVGEFHQAAQEEVAQRTGPHGLMSEVRSLLAPIVQRTPTSRRIEVIRRLWKSDNQLVELYRSVWELWAFRQDVSDERFYEFTPTGEKLRELTAKLSSLTGQLR